MYSPPQKQEYNMDTDNFNQHQLMGTPHTTVGAVPVRNSRLFNPGYHQRQNSFGTVASAIAMSPPTHRNGGMAFTDNTSQNWFGTSLDSNGSSFGQSPIFGGRDLIVSPSNSTSHLDNFTTTGSLNSNINEDDDSQQRNLQEMFEKRRRRRESHNAVERRRRDNINERIHELCSLLPERLLDTAPTSSNVMSVASGQVGANGRAINKGTILKLSVDYIKEMRDEVVKYQERINELENIVERAKRGEPIMDHKPQVFYGENSNNHNHNNNDIYSNNTTQAHINNPRGHQRVGSIQFRQQFNTLQINSNDL